MEVSGTPGGDLGGPDARWALGGSFQIQPPECQRPGVGWGGGLGPPRVPRFPVELGRPNSWGTPLQPNLNCAISGSGLLLFFLTENPARKARLEPHACTPGRQASRQVCGLAGKPGSGEWGVCRGPHPIFPPGLDLSLSLPSSLPGETKTRGAPPPPPRQCAMPAQRGLLLGFVCIAPSSPPLLQKLSFTLHTGVSVGSPPTHPDPSCDTPNPWPGVERFPRRGRRGTQCCSLAWEEIKFLALVDFICS